MYPIEEYTKMFLLHDNLYDEWHIPRPLPILNECIQKRYRDHGYEVVFVLYPDRDIFGIVPKEDDKIIYTDILFSENSAIDEKGRTKKNFVPKYPDLGLLMNQLGAVEKLVVGGYHFSDCVKRVGEFAMDEGIDTIVDLDLTDLFFSLYRQDDYFSLSEYNPERFKRKMMEDDLRYGEEVALGQFHYVYSSPAYGFCNRDFKNKNTK